MSRVATYVGGPLDGQQVTKTGSGRWPIYRDDAGQPIRTSVGDREFLTAAGGQLRRFYTHQRPYDVNTDRWVDFYVHATAWREWNVR